MPKATTVRASSGVANPSTEGTALWMAPQWEGESVQAAPREDGAG